MKLRKLAALATAGLMAVGMMAMTAFAESAEVNLRHKRNFR